MVSCAPPRRTGNEPLVIDACGLEPPEPYMLAVEKFSSLKPGDEMLFITDSWRCALLFRAEIQRNREGAILEEKVEKKGEDKEVFYIRVRRT